MKKQSAYVGGDSYNNGCLHFTYQTLKRPYWVTQKTQIHIWRCYRNITTNILGHHVRLSLW
jgi:hypothetical protein